MTNTDHSVKGLVVIHDAKKALCPQLEWAIGAALGHSVRVQWRPQHARAGALRCLVEWEASPGTAAHLASSLAKWPVHFETVETASADCDAVRIMHTPHLGTISLTTDAAGEIVLTEDRIRALIATHGADPVSMTHALERALGEPWDRALEPLRKAADAHYAVRAS